MLELGALAEAEQLCRRAIALDPALPSAHFNLSHALKAMNRLEEAAGTARAAIALRPASADYHFHLAHILLLTGDLPAGWDEYEWRLKMPDFGALRGLLDARTQPVWRGEDIQGKTILVYTEQGLGDIIQFARYLPLLVQRAGRVVVAAHSPVRRLLATIAGLVVIPLHEAALADCDVQCPLLSLPRAFGTRLEDIPAAAAPYLRAGPSDRARWNTAISGGVLRVGIVWAGNPATQRDRFRSPHLRSVLPLFSVPGIEFVVLQAGPGRAEIQDLPLPPDVVDLGGDVADLMDTAAIMSGLDLMISSCTGPLHLAAALGVPSWAMIPFAPHFTWLMGQADSPWYPSARLYRQGQPGQDWSDVIGCIAADLADLVAVQSGGSAARTNTEAPCMLPSAAPPAQPDGFNELARCRSGLMLFNRNDIYIGASLRKYSEFSGGETALFDIIVQPGMTVLDIGANIGVHTVGLSRLVEPFGAVHAFGRNG